MGGDEVRAEEEAATDSVEVGFVEVPPMVVNLRTSGGQPRFLKVHFLIVPTSASKKTEIEAKLPLIIDRFQPFLRELRPEDLSGSAAVYRIKEEMMVRAGKIVGDAAIRDILIQDLVEK
ncbi:flagellar basal body protein FliL (plasmid) [Erythrobacter aureus]|uniref:Flagellar protein FliL n=2 Tax=Erythrobacter aureus TaxID=2182384 RepID=A0A345YJR1_9SPHN|nr:flagellar basal body protein FliL [Erythrobacter aureus]